MRAVGIAIALAAIGCKRSEPKPSPAPAPAVKPPAIARPSRMPAPVTLDELTARQPALTGARVVTPLAIDGSGKQGLATACVTGADADAAAKAIADQLAGAGWKPPTVQKAAFAADLEIVDGAIHLQGQVRSTAACNAGELAVELAYTKMIPAQSL